MHPLVTDLNRLSDDELQTRINLLTSRYFQSHDLQVQSQIQLYLATYNAEAGARQQAAWQKMMDKPDKNIDKLININ